MKTKFQNIKVGTYGQRKTLEARDHEISEYNDEPYKPSELTKIVMRYVTDNKVKTDFNSLVSLSKEIDDYGYSLIIEPSGELLLYDTDY